MKTKIFIAIIAIIAIGIAVIGCGEDDNTTTTPESFTVTFHANGGTPEPAQQSIVKGKTATEPTGVTKEDNTLEGWYKENTFATKWNFATNTVTANVDLFARWVLAETAFREFKDKEMFAEVYTPTFLYYADIADGRTGARYKTLEQLDVNIVEQLQRVVSAAYTASGNAAKSRFANVFGELDGRVVITIDNDATNTSYIASNRKAVSLNIDYLLDEETTDAVLQAAISAMVTEMNGKPLP